MKFHSNSPKTSDGKSGASRLDFVHPLTKNVLDEFLRAHFPSKDSCSNKCEKDYDDVCNAHQERGIIAMLLDGKELLIDSY